MPRKAKFIEVTVLGIPSADVGEFFNSIKFDVREVELEIDDNGEAVWPDPVEPEAADLPAEFEVLNWYIFPAPVEN